LVVVTYFSSFEQIMEGLETTVDEFRHFSFMIASAEDGELFAAKLFLCQW
jgi:hypothetical protein